MTEEKGTRKMSERCSVPCSQQCPCMMSLALLLSRCMLDSLSRARARALTLYLFCLPLSHSLFLSISSLSSGGVTRQALYLPTFSHLLIVSKTSSSSPLSREI